MTLNPQAQGFLNRVAKAGKPSFRELGVEATRAMGPRLQRLAGPAEPLARVEDVVVPGDQPVPVRLYSPVAGGADRPTLVYAHGGGWALGSIDEADVPLRALANRSGWDIVSVDYRLAPEHPHPAGSDDFRAALAWAARAASVLAVGGDSAGGALAAQAALWWRGDDREPAVELLLGIYPALDDDLDRASYERNSAYGLSREDVDWFFSLSFPDGADRAGAFPLQEPSLAGLPRTLVVSAEYDILIDEATDLVKRLQGEGVPVTHRVLPGTIHGFFQLGAIMDAAAEAVDLLAAELREIAAPPLPNSVSLT